MAPAPKRTFTVQSPDEAAAPQMPGIDDIYPETKPAPPSFLPPVRRAGVDVRDGLIKIGVFTLTGKGLEIAGNVSQEEWSKVGEALFKLEGSIQWLIGDWLVCGEGVHYGDLEAFAAEIEKDYGTLRNYASVARNVNLSLRNDKLSYHHHVAVAKLTHEQQQYALEYAAASKPSVAAFRKWIKDQQEGVEVMPDALPAGDKPHTDKDLEIVARDLIKFRQMNPAKAKPQEVDRVRAATDEMQREINDIRRQWGIE